MLLGSNQLIYLITEHQQFNLNKNGTKKVQQYVRLMMTWRWQYKLSPVLRLSQCLQSLGVTEADNRSILKPMQHEHTEKVYKETHKYTLVNHSWDTISNTLKNSSQEKSSDKQNGCGRLTGSCSWQPMTRRWFQRFSFNERLSRIGTASPRHLTMLHHVYLRFGIARRRTAMPCTVPVYPV